MCLASQFSSYLQNQYGLGKIRESGFSVSSVEEVKHKILSENEHIKLSPKDNIAGDVERIQTSCGKRDIKATTLELFLSPLYSFGGSNHCKI